MSAISSHFMPKGRNTSIVQVCSYKEKCMEGTLRFLRLEQECPFRNLMQFLSLMDAVMDLDNQRSGVWSPGFWIGDVQCA